jgi:SAM-dependent methyltransferase
MQAGAQGHTAEEQERVNRRVYWSPKVVQFYTGVGLFVSETAALLRYQLAFVNRDILDLGIGPGRTTRLLAPIARRYVGVDYSEVMVNHMRKAMPEIDVRHANMRDLSEFDSRRAMRCSTTKHTSMRASITTLLAKSGRSNSGRRGFVC